MSFKRQQPPGISFAPAYEVSGVPYVTSSAAKEVGSTAVRVSFPFVTRWLEIVNTGTEELRIGFTKNGVEGKGAATLPDDVIFSGSKSEEVDNVAVNGRKNFFILAGSGSSGNYMGRARWELRCSDVFFASQGVGTSFSICAGLTTIPRDSLNLTGSQGFLGVG